MKKFLLILLLFVVTYMIGCEKTTTTNSDEIKTMYERQDTTITEEEPEQEITEAVIEQENIVKEEPMHIEKNKDSQDYTSFIGDWKLSVLNNEELYRLSSMFEFLGSTGITITEINGKQLQGKIYSIQGPPSYRQAEVIFSGEIIDGKLKTIYVDENWGNSGTILLTFEEEKIRADIQRDEDTPSFWGIPEGEFIFLKAIETEEVPLLAEEREKLTSFLLQASKDKLSFHPEELQIQLYLQDKMNENTYYLIVDFIKGEQKKNQYYIKLEKGQITSFKEITEPIPFELIR